MMILNELKGHSSFVQLKEVKQDDKIIYLVMEYVPAGDLFELLTDKRRFKKSLASFYLAQIVIMIEYLHDLDIIYRDLKPENLLLCMNGYLKLNDFGLSK